MICNYIKLAKLFQYDGHNHANDKDNNRFVSVIREKNKYG